MGIKGRCVAVEVTTEMSGPDTFMQASAAFLDFDDDSDVDDSDNKPDSPAPTPQPPIDKPRSESDPSWADGFYEALNKKRLRSKQEPQEEAFSKRQQAYPTISRLSLSQPSTKPPPCTDSAAQYTEFAQWMTQKKMDPSIKTEATKKPKGRNSKGGSKRDWGSSDETDDDTEQDIGVSSRSDEEDLKDVHCLYGCPECDFAWEGCVQCRKEDPMVQRPKIIWDPAHPHLQQDIPSGPVFYPTKAQFRDPFKYIAQIRSKAEKYGICMIVPPKSWTPPSDPLSGSARDYEFYPKRQLVSSLSIRGPLEDDDGEGSDDEASGSESAEEFGFVPSEMPFSFHSFKAFADWAHHLYFNKNSEGTAPECPTTEQMEGEFWRLVESGDQTEFETFYGSDLDASKFPNAFFQAPQSSIPYKADWHISMFPRSEGSVLRHLPGRELINGVMIPWIYFGSSLSAFCWHIEDHALYSINYLHQGANKIWYGVPGSHVQDFEAAMKDAFPKLFEDDPRLLHRLITHLSPTELHKRGIPVYRLEHQPGSFVITFPNGYHGGFNCGWNCAEAVNFAPPDWLPHGTDILHKYKFQQRPTNFSHDALLLHIVASIHANTNAHVTPLAMNYAIGELYLRVEDTAHHCSVALKNGIQEEIRMTGFKNDKHKRGLCRDSQDMDCEVCKCDLYLAAVVSPMKPKRIVCPEHASHLPHDRILLYRHSIPELQKLLEDAKRLYPEGQDYIDRAKARGEVVRESHFVKRGPFCVSPGK